MALEDLRSDEDLGNQLGLAQSPYINFNDPLTFARTQGALEGAYPGIRVSGATPPNILLPKLENQVPPARRPEGSPSSNPLSPVVQQQGQPSNGLFGNLNALLMARANSQQQNPPPRGTPYGPDVIPKIRAAAQKYGVNPNVAVAVFRSEGASGYAGDDGSSFGGFQLHMGGLSKKYPNPGLGDQFLRDTGLDPRDPKTHDAQIDYSMKHASQFGWGAWSGSRDSAGRFLGLPTEGISPFYGIKEGGKEGETPITQAFAPLGPLTGGIDQQKLWKYMLLRTLFPQFQFQNISYDPWKVHEFATRGGY